MGVDMNRYNVAYGLDGVQYCLLIEARTAEDAERAARRIVPGAEYYYAEDVGE